MALDLALTPNGRLRLIEADRHAQAPEAGWAGRVQTGFLLNQAGGLFALAATEPSVPPPPTLAFWRDFACRYLSEACRMPEFAELPLDPIPPPSESEVADFLLSVPPMRGGEYVNYDVIHDLWVDLDAWVRGEMSSTAGNPGEWLRSHAPIWHQVGRICFHLAENKLDPEFPFAFLATYAPALSKGGRVQYQPLGKALTEYAGERNRKALINLLKPIQRVSEKIEFVGELVESGDIYHPLAWSPGEAYRLLKSVPLLEENGLLVRLPDWWRKRPKPRVGVTIGDKKQGRFGADSMLDFSVSLYLGDENLTDEEWSQISASEDGLVFFKGQWVEVDSSKLSEALKHWRDVEAEVAEEGISFIDGMRLLAGASADLSSGGIQDEEEQEWAFIGAGQWLSDIVSRLRNPDSLDSGGIAKGFRGTLRHYQRIGCNWLWFLSNLGLGACLADDMGLGKTVQILSLLLAIKEQTPSGSPSLLVLPASLLSNWRDEIRRFAPALGAVFVHPSETDKASLETLAGNPDAIISKADVVITTYGMLLRQEWLLGVSWRLVILDEAQAIKNPSTRQTRTVKLLKAQSRIALTGTPVENRLADLWSLFDFLCPGLLGSTTKFKSFVKGLEDRSHDRYGPLRNLVQPYILRRLKTDKSIITDLPDKTEMKAFCGLTRKQAGLYAKSVENLTKALADVDGIKRRGLVLSYLMRFKQICNHPSQYAGDGLYKPADSGKFDRLRVICEEIASRQEKVLVFTQFREMTEPIATFLSGVFGSEGLVLHGGTAVKKRKTLIDMFQDEDGPPFFVLSLKAGGTGLNLTAASHVVHFDRWWNPAVENQATDRAFRIGQHRNVVVHKFVCRGTVEEKIDALIEEKTALADGVLSAGTESMLTEMSDDELLSIVALDIERTNL